MEGEFFQLVLNFNATSRPIVFYLHIKFNTSLYVNSSFQANSATNYNSIFLHLKTTKNCFGKERRKEEKAKKV